MSNAVKYRDEFLQFVHLIFYFSNDNLEYNSFCVDFKKRGTMQYFLNSFIEWIKENYNINITNMESHGRLKDATKFEITDKIMDDCMNFGIIPKVTYELNTKGINRVKI